MSAALDLKRQAKGVYHQGEHDRAGVLMRQAWDVAEAAGDDAVCAQVAHSAADLFVWLDRIVEAEDMARRAVEHKRRTGQNDIYLGNYLAFLARLLGRIGKPAEAVSYARGALAAFEDVFGVDHRETGMVRGLLARLVRQDEATHE
jgi:hypothetical protein